MLSMMRVPKVKKAPSSHRRPPSIGSNQSGGRLALCDGNLGDAPCGTGSSSCMEVDQMESNLAAIQGLVQARSGRKPG